MIVLQYTRPAHIHNCQFLIISLNDNYCDNFMHRVWEKGPILLQKTAVYCAQNLKPALLQKFVFLTMEYPKIVFTQQPPRWDVMVAINNDQI